jgi:hypothetical protein
MKSKWHELAEKRIQPNQATNWNLHNSNPVEIQVIALFPAIPPQ